MPQFIRLLPQQISLEEACEQLSIDYSCVSNWIARFRELLMLHDPTGAWEARVRLGIKFHFQGRCSGCGFEGDFLHASVSLSGRRRVICPGCRRACSVDQIGKQPRVRITHDPVETSWRRRGKVGFPGAQASTATLPERKAPRPAAPLPSGLPKEYSRRDLVAFLNDAIEQALSTDTLSCRCARCQSSATRLVATPSRSHPLPRFACDDCGRYFTRTTGTPMENALRRDLFPQFVALLPRRISKVAAAAELGVTPEAVSRWLERFADWLRVLDPTGRYASLVMLGQRA